MAITPGVDTWATVAEADAYLTNLVGASNWFALPISNTTPGTASKEAYLVSAFYWLSGVYGLAEDAAAPDLLKRAQAIAAQWLIENQEDYKAHDAIIASGVTEFSWSQWTEKLATSVRPPRSVSSILVQLGIGGSNQAVQLYGEDYSE